MASRLSLNSLTSTLGSTLFSKKKFQFDVCLELLILENCTFVTGLLFGKIHLTDGGNFTAFSDRIEVQKHRVRWNAMYKFPCKMYANASTGVLESCICKISIRKETKGGRSASKLGFVKINLAEYAGAGEVERKYLLESYNENKHKPDNSVVKVRISLKQTYGDSLYKAPTAKLYEIDEGIGDDDDILSLCTATPRASTVSTVSGLSIGTGGFSVAGSRSSSSANLRDSAASLRMLENYQKPVHREEQSEAGGSDNTVVEQSEDTRSSTVETNSTTKDTASLVPSRTTRQAAELKQRLTITKHTTTKAMSDSQTSSYKDLRSSPTLRQAASQLQPAPVTTSSLNRRLKAGPSVSSSLVTALPGSAGVHRRQASWGAWYGGGGSPSGEHRRHNSTSSYMTSPLEIQEITSYNSSKTKATTVSSQSRVEQSRVNTESVLNEVFAESDLTLDDDCENNLKLYVDTQQGGTVMTGHELADRRRFKQIDVCSETAPVRPARRHKKPPTDTPQS